MSLPSPSPSSLSLLNDGMMIVEDHHDDDDDGDGFIPAPPSPPPSPRTIASSMGSSVPSRDSVSAAIALVRAKQMAKSNNNNKATAASIVEQQDLGAGEEQPMRERVFQPRSFSSDQSSSTATDSSSAANKIKKNDDVSITDLTEIENAIPSSGLAGTSAGTAIIIGEQKTTTTTTTTNNPDDDELSSSEGSNQQEGERKKSFFSIVNNVFSSRSEAQATTSSASLPKRPSFEQQQQQQQQQPSEIQYEPSSTTTLPVSSNDIDIPAVPSGGDDDDEEEELPAVDADTLEDVNAFLNRLGVGALGSTMPSLEYNNSDDSTSIIHAVDSIEKMRLALSSSLSGASSCDTEEDSSIGEVQPETLAEISAFIDSIAKKDEERKLQQCIESEHKSIEEPEILENLMKDEDFSQADSNDNKGVNKREGNNKNRETEYDRDAEAQVRTSRPSPIYELLSDATPGASKDPPSTLAYDVPIKKADPPGPPSTMHLLETDEEKKSEDGNDDDDVDDVDDVDEEEENGDGAMDNEDSNTQFADTSFNASVRKTLSTVVEVASTEDDDNSNGYNENMHHIDDVGSVDTCDKLECAVDESRSCTLQAIASEEESVYGDDGRKEPRGTYEEADVQVEQIPVCDIGVEQNINEMNALSRMSSVDSQNIGTERYAILEHVSGSASDTVVAEDDTDNSVTSYGLSETGSVPWALRDVASEETMRATGRTRAHFVVSGPRPSNKSRNITSLLSDDTSIQASEAVSEVNNEFSANLEALTNDSDDDDDSVESCDRLLCGNSGEVEIMANRSLVTDNDDEEENEFPQTEGGNTEEIGSIMSEVEENLGDQNPVVEFPGDNEIESIDTSSSDQDCDDTGESEEEMPAFEVGQGVLSPTKISRFVSAIDHQPASGSDQEHLLQHFKELIVPLVDGHRPTLVETAQIRQAAQKADISLDLVDQFLDDVNDTSTNIPSIGPNSSSMDEHVLSWKTSFEAHNEDDDDIAAFLCQIKEARVAAVKKAISAAAAEVEAAMNVEEDDKVAKVKDLPGGEAEDKVTTLEAIDSPGGEIVPKLEVVEADDSSEHSNPFLRQFEDLDMKEDWENDDSVKENNDHVETQSLQDPPDDLSGMVSPTMLINYFTTIDRRQIEGGNDEKCVNEFRRLMMPVVEGKKPTIIEEAQIRQAALKANVPLDFVDTFLDYVNEGHPEVVPQASSEEDRDLLLKGWEEKEIEDLNEDAAIAAFLSSKSGAPVSEERDQAKEVEVEDVDEDEYIARNRLEPSSHEVEGNGSQRDHTDYPTSLTRRTFDSSSNEEGDSNQSKFSATKSNDPSGSEGYGYEEEAKENVYFGIPKVVGTATTKRHENENEILRVDTDIRKACMRIQNYDEGVWQRRTAMATYGWGWEEATWLSPRKSPKVANLSEIGGMATAEGISNFMFNKKSFPFARENCKLSYKRRTKPHVGYFSVDVNSLQESAAFGGEDLPQDETPWELRYVRQRFLHERSLTFSRNWFGNLVNTRGNDKIKAPVCKPKSMEMPMRNIPDPGDWTPEWYTTWESRKLHLPRPSTEGSRSDSDSENSGSEEGSQVSGVSGSYSSSSSYDDDEWEEAPECGTLVNTRQKIGEHVTRVHPDFTSSLRKSRWRKKYFPAGSFPY
ncbi:MAG: hypothetical protein ACI8RD_007469 [Bacillariaceae sp.]|jgi:hypothetical protein